MDPNCTQVLNEAQMQNEISPRSFFGCHPWKGGKKKSYVVFLTTWTKNKKQKKKMSMAAEMTVQTENT